MKATHGVQDLHRPHLTACGIVGTTFYVTDDRKLVDCKNCLRVIRSTILDNAEAGRIDPTRLGQESGCQEEG